MGHKISFEISSNFFFHFNLLVNIFLLKKLTKEYEKNFSVVCSATNEKSQKIASLCVWLEIKKKMMGLLIYRPRFGKPTIRGVN